MTSGMPSAGGLAALDDGTAQEPIVAVAACPGWQADGR